MDYLYLFCGILTMVIVTLLQFHLCRKNIHHLIWLPLGFAILTFWFGLLSLLFSFALIFVGQLCFPESPDQMQQHDSL